MNGFVAVSVNHAVANAHYNILRMLPSSVVNCRFVKHASVIFLSVAIVCLLLAAVWSCVVVIEFLVEFHKL